LPDLFVTHLTDETHTLWKQMTPGFFQDRSLAAGVTATRWRGTGFGTVLADFNCDGWLDLAWVNGRVSQRKEGLAAWPADFFKLYAERHQPSASSCWPTPGRAASATSRPLTRRYVARPESAVAWRSATWTAMASRTCCSPKSAPRPESCSTACPTVAIRFWCVPSIRRSSAT